MNIAEMKFSVSFLLLPNLFNLRCLFYINTYEPLNMSYSVTT